MVFQPQPFYPQVPQQAAFAPQVQQQPQGYQPVVPMAPPEEAPAPERVRHVAGRSFSWLAGVLIGALATTLSFIWLRSMGISIPPATTVSLLIGLIFGGMFGLPHRGRVHRDGHDGGVAEGGVQQNVFWFFGGGKRHLLYADGYHARHDVRAQEGGRDPDGYHARGGPPIGGAPQQRAQEGLRNQGYHVRGGTPEIPALPQMRAQQDGGNGYHQRVDAPVAFEARAPVDAGGWGGGYGGGGPAPNGYRVLY